MNKKSKIKYTNPEGSQYLRKGYRGFIKGNPGKPFGAVSRFTTLKNAFVNVFQRIGGEDAMYEWLNPRPMKVVTKKGVKYVDISANRKLEFFKLISKMLPADVQLSGSITENIVEKFKAMPNEELVKRLNEVIRENKQSKSGAE